MQKCVICGKDSTLDYRGKPRKTCSNDCLAKHRSQRSREFYKIHPKIAPKRPFGYERGMHRDLNWEFEKDIEDRDFIESELSKVG